MGWFVFANVQIHLPKDISVRYMKNIITMLNRLEEEYQDITKIKKYGRNVISFELDGNKFINYEPLDKIKSYLQELRINDFQIAANEYVEDADGGYYFDSNDEDEIVA